MSISLTGWKKKAEKTTHDHLVEHVQPTLRKQIAAAPVVADAHGPDVDADLAVAAAKKRWKARFRSRVQAMEVLLARAPEDTTPTPPTDGDD